MLLACALAALMAVVGLALPDPGQTGSLTITRLANGAEAADPVVGAEFTIARLPHDAAGGSLDLTTNAGWERAGALSLAQALDLPGVDQQTAVTDAEGVVVFSPLSLGLWLVTETSTPEGHGTSAPFVVAIPFTNETGDGWLYDLAVYPKAASPVPLSPAVSIEITYGGWVNPGEGNFAGAPAAAALVAAPITVYSRARNTGDAPLFVRLDKYTHLGAIEKTDFVWTFNYAPLFLDEEGTVFLDAAHTAPLVLAPGQYVLGRALLAVPAYGEYHGTTARVHGTIAGSIYAPVSPTALSSSETATVTVSDVDFLYARGALAEAVPPSPPPTEQIPPRPNLPVTGGDIAIFVAVAAALTGLGAWLAFNHRKKEAADA
ncbi:MAG: SpaH/EbpB family LPXTG-anchored major pilin [Promicromonosporaceae bacterium]|nr:SpaH/EbpB family LPXTG-anchored major pilin [Promicromonosporaceae bacterium]